jgi:glutamyl-tRNA synthetase
VNSKSTAAAGRLAPSPSGRLHIGHARTFLVAWWRARSCQAKLTLRIEDLDAGRCNQEHIDGVLEDLEWLGLDWDGQWRLQSSGLEPMRDQALKLATRGLAYACTCTRKEIAAAQSAPHGEEGPRYPGTCRGLYKDLDSARLASGREPALRVQVPEGELQFVDQLHGARCVNVQQTSGDFPLLTRGGEPSYQLAVVVDDARDGVEEVVRGGDLLDVTARQIVLQRLLGYSTPRYAHVPLIVDVHGTRLAKRSAGLTLAELRARGVRPTQVVGAVARISGMPAADEGNPRDFCASFALDRIPTGPWWFDTDASSFRRPPAWPGPAGD